MQFANKISISSQPHKIDNTEFRHIDNIFWTT